MIKFVGLIAGGLGDKVWDKEFEVEANTFKEAVEKIYKTFTEDEDIVEMKQEDYPTTKE